MIRRSPAESPGLPNRSMTISAVCHRSLGTNGVLRNKPDSRVYL